MGYNFAIMLKLLLLIGVLSAVSVPAQSQQQPANGSQSADTSKPDQRGTENSPLVVNEHTIHSDKETAEETARDAEQKRTNSLNIKLTFAIAICAGLQFAGIVGQIFVYIWQARLLRETKGEIHTQAGLMKDQLEVMRDQAKDARESAAQATSIAVEAAKTAQISAGAAVEQFRAMQIQADEMAAQTAVAKTAAEAAKTSADHMITSERAWLTIRPIKRDLPKPGMMPMFHWEIKNVGNTPARLIETNAACFACKDKMNPDEVPEYVFGPSELSKRILAPGDFEPFLGFIKEKGILLGELYDQSRPIYFLAYGYIKYLNVLSEKECISSFCEYCWVAEAGAMEDLMSDMLPEDVKRSFDFKPVRNPPAAYTKNT